MSAPVGNDRLGGGAPGVWRPRGLHDEVASVKAYRSGDEARRVRELADKFAAVGYHVVVPDFRHRDPFVPRQAGRSFGSWLNGHKSGNAFESAKLVTLALRGNNITRVVVAIGFSLGATVVVELAKSNQFIEAAVLLESSSVTLEDIQGVRIPIFIAALRHSNTAMAQLMGQFKDFLSRKYSIHSHVELYPKLEDAERSSEIERLDGNRLDKEGPTKCAVLAYKDLLRWIDWIIVLSLVDSRRPVFGTQMKD